MAQLATLVHQCLDCLKANLEKVEYPFECVPEDILQLLIADLVLVERKGGKRVSGKQLKILLSKASARLTRLSISGTCIGCVAIGSIGNLCPAVRHLNLSFCRFADTESLLKVVSNLPALQHLDLSFVPSVQNSVLVAVSSNCRGLRSLKIRRCVGVTDIGISSLRNCRDLRILDVANCTEVTGSCLPHISSNCLQLEEVITKNCQKITDYAMEHVLSSCSSLVVLNVKSCCRLTNKSFENFCCFKLRKLNVGFCGRITMDAVFQVVAHCPELQVLCAQQIMPAAPECIERTICQAAGRKIAKLSLLSPPGHVTDHVLEVVALHCPNLSQVYLGSFGGNYSLDTFITDRGLKQLFSYCSTVRTLDLSRVSITDECLMSFCNIPLQILSLRNCTRVSAMGMSALLLHCKQLEKLSLVECNVDDPVCVAIAEGCPLLKEVRLPKSRLLSDHGITELAVGLERLRCLIIAGTSVTARSVGIALRKWPLKVLDISFCRYMTDELVGCLEEVPTGRLRKLGIEGMLWVRNQHINNIIRRCPLLEHLYASGCESANGTTVRLTGNPRLNVHLSKQTLSVVI